MFCDVRGIDSNELFTPEIERSQPYQLAVSDVYIFLSNAMDISQGGVTIRLSDTQKQAFSNKANEIRKGFGLMESKFGYKGTRL